MAVAVVDEEIGHPIVEEGGHRTMIATPEAAPRKGVGVVSVMIATEEIGILMLTDDAISYVTRGTHQKDQT